MFVEDGQRDGLNGGGHLGAGGEDDVGPGRHEVEPVRLLLVADVVRGHQALGADEHRYERGSTELRTIFYACHYLQSTNKVALRYNKM